MNLRTIILEALTILSSFSTLVCCAAAGSARVNRRRRRARERCRGSATTRLAF